jgi:hypothetical protein
MNYTKENAGYLSLETILKWIEEDNTLPTIADELRKKKNYGGGSIARHDVDTYEKLQYRQDEDNANWYYDNQK